jgi:hypothetical protein
MMRQKSGRHPELVSGSLLNVSSLLFFGHGGFKAARSASELASDYKMGGTKIGWASCFALHEGAPPVGAITDYGRYT